MDEQVQQLSEAVRSLHSLVTNLRTEIVGLRSEIWAHRTEIANLRDRLNLAPVSEFERFRITPPIPTIKAAPPVMVDVPGGAIIRPGLAPSPETEGPAPQGPPAPRPVGP